MAARAGRATGIVHPHRSAMPARESARQLLEGLDVRAVLLVIANLGETAGDGSTRFIGPVAASLSRQLKDGLLGLGTKHCQGLNGAQAGQAAIETLIHIAGQNANPVREFGRFETEQRRRC